MVSNYRDLDKITNIDSETLISIDKNEIILDLGKADQFNIKLDCRFESPYNAQKQLYKDIITSNINE